MSKDIKAVGAKFKDILQLTAFAEAQHKTIDKLTKRCTELQEEVEHLKTLISSTTELLPKEQNVTKIIVSKEEAVLDAQINLLYQRALDKELTLEETKKLDLLIKNKEAIKEKSIPAKSKKFDRKDVSDAELILLAERDIKTNE